jgi:hypothetical protein
MQTVMNLTVLQMNHTIMVKRTRKKGTKVVLNLTSKRYSLI